MIEDRLRKLIEHAEAEKRAAEQPRTYAEQTTPITFPTVVPFTAAQAAALLAIVEAARVVVRSEGGKRDVWALDDALARADRMVT